ncbi:MAG TPA: signal peptidase II [Candidatus Angelobacter sp.]|nr:signal peptidase II [Candidatus Angelobacter sp.]
MTPGFRRLLLVCVVLLPCVGCDQMAKVTARHYLPMSPITYLSGLLRLQYVENSGAFLSAGSNLSESGRFWVFTIFTGMGLIGLLLYVATSRKLQSAQVIAFSLMIGGGAGNLIDRIFNHGAVIDFLNLGVGSLRTGVFNAADVEIMAGITLLLLQTFVPTKPSANLTLEETGR